MAGQFNAEIAWEAIPQIWKAYLIHFPVIDWICIRNFLWLFVASLRMSKDHPLRWLAMLDISLMRGIPLMVLLFFIYFGLPFMGIQLDANSAFIIAFTSMSSAYISEIIRASLSAIDKGQWRKEVAWLENKRDLPKNHHSSSLSDCSSTSK